MSALNGVMPLLGNQARERLAATKRATATRIKLTTDPDGRKYMPRRNLTYEEEERELSRLRTLSKLLDSAFVVPFINFRIGLDAIVGIIPGIGDSLMMMPSAYIVYQGYKLGLPKEKLVQMIGNITIEFLVGVFPIFGDLFDAAFRSNLRNVAIIEKHIQKKRQRPHKFKGLHAH